MNIQTYNDWYVSTDTRLGAWNVSTEGPTNYQIHNATKIYNALTAYGWSISAVCGIIGNMQHESNLSPAWIEETNRWRLSSTELADVPNLVMQNFYNEYYHDSRRGYGLGLCQWDGKGITRQKLVGYCENNGYVWYNGDAQMARLLYEHDHDLQWQTHTYYGTSWTWNNYVTNTMTPEESARIWCGCYEISGGVQYRQENARYWYDYFSGGPIPPTPPTPDDWITGLTFTSLALAYDPEVTGVQIPYSQMDCIQYVQTVWRDIQAVSSTDVLCNPSDGHFGTNSLWRQNISPYPTWTFNTTSPDNQNPTPVLWWKGTISECEAEFGEIPAGALLFHQIGEDDNPQIPPYYRGDGIGNFVHVGIYCGFNTVMQSGGRDSASVPGGGVHKSVYDASAWNYVAFVVYVNCTGSGPTPPPPPPPTPWIKTHMYILAINKKDVKNNVKAKLCF